MNIIDKLTQEQRNIDSIYLHSDGGIFVRAYDKSAFALEVLTGRKLQVNVKYNSKMKRQYVFVGFPVKALSDFIFQYIKEKKAYFTVEPEDDNHVIYVIRKEYFVIDEDMYQKWFSSHINKTLQNNGREKTTYIKREKKSKEPEAQEGGRCVLPASVYVNIYLHEGMHVQVQKG